MSDPKRPRGRPPIDPTDPSVPLTVRFPGKQLEDAAERARAERLTLPEWIRRALRDTAERDPR